MRWVYQKHGERFSNTSSCVSKIIASIITSITSHPKSSTILETKLPFQRFLASFDASGGVSSQAALLRWQTVLSSKAGGNPITSRLGWRSCTDHFNGEDTDRYGYTGIYRHIISSKRTWCFSMFPFTPKSFVVVFSSLFFGSIELGLVIWSGKAIGQLLVRVWSRRAWCLAALTQNCSYEVITKHELATFWNHPLVWMSLSSWCPLKLVYVSGTFLNSCVLKNLKPPWGAPPRRMLGMCKRFRDWWPRDSSFHDCRSWRLRNGNFHGNEGRQSWRLGSSVIGCLIECSWRSTRYSLHQTKVPIPLIQRAGVTVLHEQQGA